MIEIKLSERQLSSLIDLIDQAQPNFVYYFRHTDEKRAIDSIYRARRKFAKKRHHLRNKKKSKLTKNQDNANKNQFRSGFREKDTLAPLD